MGLTPGPIRILHVVTIMNRAGLETMLMNYYRNIDRTKFQFDFLVHRTEKGAYDDEIKKLGGRIFYAPAIGIKGLFKYPKALSAFFSDHPEYRIVHSHLDALSALPLAAAKKAGIPVRIAHAHNNNFDYDLKLPTRLILKKLINRFATDYLACSRDAAIFMFSRKIKFDILYNAIDTNHFKFNLDKRSRVRSDLDIEDKLVIGHVGRFTPQKNHKFLIKVFYEILQLNPESTLLLVGDGSMLSNISEYVERLGIMDSVIFLGSRSDVADLIQAMDVFVFPSIYEGLGVVLIEAQANGLPCVISDKVSSGAIITDGVVTCSLNATPKLWAHKIIGASKLKKVRNAKVDEKYNIRDQARRLMFVYKNMAIRDHGFGLPSTGSEKDRGLLTHMRARWFASSFIIISIVCLFLGVKLGSAYIIYVANLLLLSGVVLYALKNIYSWISVILFFGSIFIFNLGRFGIEWLNGLAIAEINWGLEIINFSSYFDDALLLVYISTISLFIGALISEKIIVVFKDRSRNKNNKSSLFSKINSLINSAQFVEYFKKYLHLSLIITAISAYVIAIESLVIFHGQPYHVIYSTSLLEVTSIPRLFHFLNALFPFMSIAVLATLPKLKPTLFMIAGYVGVTLPALYLGQRMPFYNALLLALVYLVFRLEKSAWREKITRLMKYRRTMVISFIAIALSLLLLMNAVDANRGGDDKIEHSNPIISSAQNILFEQGYSLNVIAYGVALENKMPTPYYGSYAFSEAAATALCSIPLRYVNPNLCLGNSKNPNNLESSTKGANSALALSPLVLGEKRFTDGQGVGSNYTIDLFFDGGVLLVSIGSLALGAFLVLSHSLFKLNSISRYLTLLLLTSVFILPRETFSDFMTPLFYTTPYMVFILLVFLSYLTPKIVVTLNSLRDRVSL